MLSATVLPMGFINSVSIAQHLRHEGDGAGRRGSRDGAQT